MMVNFAEFGFVDEGMAGIGYRRIEKFAAGAEILQENRRKLKEGVC